MLFKKITFQLLALTLLCCPFAYHFTQTLHDSPHLFPSTLRESLPSFLHLAEPSEQQVAAPSIFIDPEFQALSSEQQPLSQYIKDVYKIPARLASEIVSSTYQAAAKYSLDPLLILSIIQVESTFQPKVVSNMDARGLMQIVPLYHERKIASLQDGEEQLFHPPTNIRVGTSIFSDFLKIAKGNEMKALLFYNGSSKDPEQAYAKKVYSAKNEFLRVAAYSPVPRE
jgi:soluble lytic murein transglycosylase-like protein